VFKEEEMSQSGKDIRKLLFEQQDLVYQAFSRKLVPGVDPSAVIGVRIPHLRKIARSVAGSTMAMRFMADLPHTYLEENNLHALLIEPVTDFESAMNQINTFLPFIDNWSTCDLLAPKVFGKQPALLYQQITVWLDSDRTYTLRFAVGMLMRHYLDDAFQPKLFDLVTTIHSDAYYVKMMIAWFFATALAKQPDATLPILQSQRLDRWTQNKAIQKAIESRRIDELTKVYLRTFKVG
jgi:3-methyladenine DNA glycosylase AlkD